MGFVLRTSQTATMPSCDATANFIPFAENAVENDAASDDGEWNGVASTGGRDRVTICENVILPPPVIE